MFKALCLALAILMLVWPQIFAGYSQRRHERRLKDLQAGGEEQFFEEARSLAAYPPMSRLPVWRFLGAALILVSVGGFLVRH